MKGRNKKLDVMKWIAAWMVVAIHTSPLESVNKLADFVLTRELSRLAVPFFFMTTGYYILGKGREKSYIGRLLLLYLFGTLLYFPIQVYKWMNQEQAPVSLIAQILKSLFFDGTYYHLWYFPAVILGILLCMVLLKAGKKTAFITACVLYIIGLFGDSYYGFIENLFPINGLYDLIFRISSYTRNGVFFAPLFLLLGYLFSNENGLFFQKASDFRMFLAALSAMCLEGLVLHHLGVQKHDSMYVLLPLVSSLLFLYLIKQNHKHSQQKIIFVKYKTDWRTSLLQKGPMVI